jgi:hypothetical protein
MDDACQVLLANVQSLLSRGKSHLPCERGLANKAIASRIGVTVGTVKRRPARREFQELPRELLPTRTAAASEPHARTAATQ